MLTPFVYLRPKSTREAVDLLANHGENARIIAGGTDLLIAMKGKSAVPDYVVSLKEIRELNYVDLDQKYLRIGALTTHRQLEMSAVIKEKFPVLHDAVRQVGSVQIRNVATIGGNLCSALPSADTAAPLLVLEAGVKVMGLEGERIIPLSEFFLGAGQNALKRSEILTEVIVPVPPPKSAGAYVKLGRRKAMEIALLGAAVFLCFDNENRCHDARVALTTAAPRPIRSPGAEAALKEKIISEESLLYAGEQANMDASPRSSWRATEEYRRKVLPFLIRRAGREALARYTSECDN